MLKRVFRKLGIKPNPFMKGNRRYQDFEIGEWTYGEPKVFLGRTHGTLRIGKYCSIGPSVEFTLVGDHRTDFVTTFPFSVFFNEYKHLKGYPKHRGDINVGNDVWICSGAHILAGATIGDGAVIGLDAVVVKDVPPYAIVGGNPAKIIRYRFSPDVIKRLLLIQWWNWPHEEVLKAAPLLSNENIDAFIEYATKRTNG